MNEQNGITRHGLLAAGGVGLAGATTAKSGNHIWIPNNFELRRQGIDDDKRTCLQYMAQYSYPHLFIAEHPHLGLDQNTFALLSAFYDHAWVMLDQIMAWKILNFRTATIWSSGEATPDYFDHSPYNRIPRGRGLEPITEDFQFMAGKGVVDRVRRWLLERGCELRMRRRAAELLCDERHRVIGLAATDDSGRRLNIRARRGVVFATGCYSHNRDYLRQYQMHPVLGTCAAPTNEGDFIAIAGAVGAQLANMSGAWRSQVVLEHAIRYQSTPSAVYWPPGDCMLLVDRYGRRCVNEKRSYNDRVRQLYHYDASAVEYPHLLTFMIYDQRVAEQRAGSQQHDLAPASGRSAGRRHDTGPSGRDQLQGAGPAHSHARVQLLPYARRPLRLAGH